MNRFRAIAGIGIAGACVWWVLKGVEWSLFWSVVRHARWPWVAVAIGSFFLSLMVRSIRWHTIFRWIAPDVRPIDTLRPLYVGYLFNNVLPGKLGEVAKLVLITRFTGVSAVKSTVAIAMDRVVDGIGLAIVMGVALLISGLHNRLLIGVFLVGTVVFVGVATAMWLLARNRLLFSVLGRLGRRFNFLKGISALEAGRSDLLALHTFPRLLWILVLSVVNWTTEGGVFWAVQHAFSVPGSGAIGILTMGVVSFGGVILSTPGGVGAHEYLSTIALRAVGVSASPALAIGIMTHLIVLVPAALLGLGSVITIGWSSVTQTLKSTSEI